MAKNDRIVVGGVDTHKDVHVAAVIDQQGRILDTKDFRTNVAGYRRLLSWMRTFGDVHRTGVGGTGA
jgi:transposase